MLKSLLMGLLVIFSTNVFAESKPIELTKENTLVLRDVVRDDSVAELQFRLLEMDSELPSDEPIYLFLDTPGGSIDAGMSFIYLAKSLDREIKTITSFSASMGFIITQELGERLILPNGTLMSHRAKIGMKGEIPGEFLVRLEHFKKVIEDIDKSSAKRMGISLGEYQNLIADEYWVSGLSSVFDGAADRVVDVRCGEDLRGTIVKEINVLFFTFKVKFSECPLISFPIAVEEPDKNTSGIFNPLQYIKAKDYLNKLFYNKVEFVDEFIKTNKYLEYFK